MRMFLRLGTDASLQRTRRGACPASFFVLQHDGSRSRQTFMHVGTNGGIGVDKRELTHFLTCNDTIGEHKGLT